MAERRGRSRTRVTSQYNSNDPTNWTKAKLRGKLQELGIWTRPSYSITDLIRMYQNQSVSRVRNIVRPLLPSEETTVTTETESVPTVNELTGQRDSVTVVQDNEACSSSSSTDGRKTEVTPPRRRTGKRGSAVIETATITRPTPSLYNRMQPAAKTARYTDDNAKDLPTVRIHEKNYTAIIGEQLKLECSVSAHPLITTVSWQRILPEGQTVTLDMDELKYTGSKPNDPHLVIDDIRKDDEGTYVCTVSNLNGERQSAPTKLKVKGGLPTLNMKPKSHYKTEGEVAILKCNVIAEPPASNIVWTKEEEGGGEREIAIDNDKYHGGLPKSPSLIIAETEKIHDEGKYICEAENHAGQKSNSVHLTINSTLANTETIKTTHEEGIGYRIRFRHVQMVIALSEHICPEAKHWANFIELIKVYVPNSDLGKNLQDNVSYLERKGHISFGRYDKLFKIVNEIDKPASRIIMKAEADIKTIRKGGMPQETTTKLVCTFDGIYNQELPQKCTSQITEQFGEVSGRMTGEVSQGSIVLKFTISEMQTPHQPSALYLAVTLRTRLQNRQIVLKDESDEPLVLKTTPKVMVPTENPKDIPTIRLSRGHYRFTEGKVAILKCVVVATAETESIQWFRVKDERSHAIIIDNEKYFGGLPKSPSLAIADVKKSDRGIYFCRAGNREGEVESDIAFVEINSIGELGTRKDVVSAVTEDVFTVEEDVSSVKEDANAVMKDASAVTDISTMEVNVIKKELSTGLEDNFGIKGLYKANSEELMKERIAHEHVKMVTELSEYFSPKLDTWSKFRESIRWALPPAYLEEDLNSIVESLMKKHLIGYGQYQTLYEAVDKFDRNPSIIIKKAEAHIKAIRDGVSPMKMDVSKAKKEFGFDLDTRPGIRGMTQTYFIILIYLRSKIYT
ncbi:uncharacterized protein LOC110459019 isoform X2 [Mizuhopecten yessoensis]|uniref:uncharacterized protein LOC110459019 isoform X2 n=1 Tax=Mizuhopecten yessoensis TaxID=6573 RepID=UPI000B457E83|nr:uncharacterized protein LOC110459019 isoform X2 [Mizuhopecten yessoensis]